MVIPRRGAFTFLGKWNFGETCKCALLNFCFSLATFLVTVVWLSPEGVQYIAEQCILYYAFADKNGDEKKRSERSEVLFSRLHFAAKCI